MKLELPRLSIQKGSSVSAQIPLTLNAGESLAGLRVSAYIKFRASDNKILCPMEAKLNTEKSEISIFANPPQSDSIPAGQLIYYIELARGVGFKQIERNFLNVEP